ncbi:MAG: GNAT family N-acetyltransferase [Mycobacteriales bacterium]
MSAAAEPLAVLELDDLELVLRRATIDDVPAVVALIAGGQIAGIRDGIDNDGDLAQYQAAYRSIDVDPAHLLLVAESAGRILGTLQLSLLPGLARRGSVRGQLEAVHVEESSRGRGIGSAMLDWAIQECRRRGASLVQLTTSKSRVDAHRLYAKLGFTASPEGMKLPL